MKTLRVLTVLITLLFSSTSLCAGNQVVIQLQEDTYKFIEGKNGNLDRVEHSNTTTFRALEGDTKALLSAFYSDDIKISGASGGEVAYKSSLRDDIFFSDSKICLISTPLKKEGSTAKASFKRIFTKPEFCAKHYFLELYDIEKQTVTFEFPASMASRFNIVPKNIPADKMQLTRTQSGNKVKLTYTLTDIKSLDSEDGAPSFNVTAPQLQILGHFSDVQELYRYLYNYLPQSDPDAAAVAAKTKEITAGCTTDREKISAINDFVHRTVRYVAVEHGDFGHRPDLPSAVLKKCFGDCKGSAALIRAMLREAGIDGRFVWVGSRSIAENWSECPNITSGDHMIAAAFTGDSILYIDGTASFNPIGLLPTSYQGKEVIIEDTPEKCILAKVPIYGPIQNALTYRMEGNMLPSGNIIIDGHLTMTGKRHTTFKGFVEQIPPARRQDFNNRFFATLHNGLKMPDNATAEMSDSVTTITAKGTISGAITPSGDLLYLDLNPMHDLNGYRFATKNRTQPGQLDYRNLRDFELVVNLPDNIEATQTPADVAIDNKWISGRISTELTDGGRRIKRTFTLAVKETDIPLDSLDAYNADLNKLIRACSAKLEIKKIK